MSVFFGAGGMGGNVERHISGRRQMKALIVGGPDRGQVVDVQDDDPRVDRVLMGSHVHNFIVDADVPNPREYVMRELCRAYEYLMKGETHRQHIKKNGKL